MKLSVLVTIWTLIFSRAFASLSESTNIERPAVSLEEAVLITKAMLQMQGVGEKYYIIHAQLFGGDRDEGARWILSLVDAENGAVSVFIMTKTPDCILHYASRDPAVRGGEKKVLFSRDGLSVVRISKE